MHRRTLLLFGLFVVTAWFYSGVAGERAEMATNKHQKQLQALDTLEKTNSGERQAEEETGQG